MNTDYRPGRHRAPGGFSPLGELKTIALETAQPAMKGAAIVAAAGGLVATVAQPASAEAAAAGTPVAADARASAPVMGPSQVVTVAPSSALRTIGFAAPASKAKAAEPVVIKDTVVEAKRAEEAKEAAAERLEADRASRSTYTRKPISNATVGQRSSHNWATAGQCTWGALNKWYQSEGYYPGGWTGNAMEWAWGAASAGYTVSTTPRTRSIVVMQPGVHGSSSVGHVGWVIGVSGDQVTIVEMNALAGAYNYNTRTLTDVSGMKYIYAP